MTIDHRQPVLLHSSQHVLGARKDHKLVFSYKPLHSTRRLQYAGHIIYFLLFCTFIFLVISIPCVETEVPCSDSKLWMTIFATGKLKIFSICCVWFNLRLKAIFIMNISKDRGHVTSSSQQFPFLRFTVYLWNVQQKSWTSLPHVGEKQQ